MAQQERFRWAIWPISAGWLIALWISWDGFEDFRRLVGGNYPNRGMILGFLSTWPWGVQVAIALAQMAVLALAAPSLLGFVSGRTLLTVGETGLTFDRWRGWRRIVWRDIERLEFAWGDAVFHLRGDGRLTTLRFRPWTIGMDAEAFRALIERHQPRLTPDEDEGQPWARSSSFKP